MTDNAEKVDILIVDDKPDKLLALEAALWDLQENVVRAGSGRDALRLVLRQQFAVILLDINMPGMDGFEFAELVRSYRPSRHTPIIFMTAAGDDALLGRSYALGAVDCIHTPVVPEVLRSKVRVFADLHRKTAEVRRQAETLAQEAARLKRLTAASLTVTAAPSLEAIVRAVTDAARDVVGAELSMTTVSVRAGELSSAISVAEPYTAYRDHRPTRAAEALYQLARPAGGAARLSRHEIEADPTLRAAAQAGGPPRHGLLAAPLLERDGRWMGLIQVSDKRGGEFTEGDEAVLVQLAQLGATTLQNTLHAEAREANRLKDEFLATLSHELRTPLHALLGWTHLLRTGPLDASRLARGLEVIERNVNLQNRLIDELLDVSRIAAGKLVIEKRPVTLRPVLEEALDALRPAAEAKRIRIHTALGDDDAQVLGDASRLQQVFSNLAGNAVKFTPNGGKITVALERRHGEVEVRVSDDGVGIAPEFLPFVFERFRQADSSSTRAHGGLGLGLSVVRHLVELHGGSVLAESEGTGKGATFVIRIPELRAAPHAIPPVLLSGTREEEAPDPLEGIPRSGVQTLDGLRVLVVDDDDDARELLREVLIRHRAQVTTVSSAREALDAIDAERPDVLVSDVAMKDEDGYDLIRRVRVRRREEGGALPALALTAHARHEDRVRALEAGFQVHATKPIEPVELVATIAALADGTEREPEAG